MTAATQRVTTDSRAHTAAEMIEMACGSTDSLRRTQILAEAQPQLAWALRSAIQECLDAGHSWAQIGGAVSMPRETVFRQFAATGPIVTVKPAQSLKSPNLAAANTAGSAIYAFQTEEGEWYGPYDDLPKGEYTTAALPFSSTANPANRFAGQILRVRYGPRTEDVSFHAVQLHEADGSLRPVRVTNEIINLLFEDGQTSLRRALTALVHATIGNPEADPAFQAVVYRAADAQGVGVPGEEFVSAVQAVIDAAPDSSHLGVHAAAALQRLTKVVSAYNTWAQAMQ